MRRHHGRGWRAAITLIAFVLLALATYRLADDYRAYRRARDLKVERVAELARFRAERDEAQTTLERLQTDALAREQLVRSHGYIRPGEEVYVILPASDAAPDTPKARE